MFHWCDRLVLFSLASASISFLLIRFIQRYHVRIEKWIQVVANQILRYFSFLSTLKCSIRLCWSCYHLLLKCLLLFAHLFFDFSGIIFQVHDEILIISKCSRKINNDWKISWNLTTVYFLRILRIEGSLIDVFTNEKNHYRKRYSTSCFFSRTIAESYKDNRKWISWNLSLIHIS